MAKQGKMFRTVLVANRGEIACRVIRTLKAMGIRSVAVYSDADTSARHVREADTALRIGPAAASESYLNIDAIIRACRQSGAEAVHPGYGFLSENTAFARALEDAGIVFIGPDPEALAIMGDKIRSKNHVAAYGVPVVPGVARPGMGDDELQAAAGRVGYPLLIKPSAGGGGKGMHIVERPEDLPHALAAARRVASGAFGDDTLFLERLVSSPRHIEVQVLADTHGNVIHLGERECSLQRRHQKVIEEAPSPLVESSADPAALRARIGEAACNAARSVKYRGAGTVEFLVSDEHPDEFFFMEMNTRLQVEHPVTEMVTGIDLVEWQVRIAAGEVLALGPDGAIQGQAVQGQVVLSGHAVEARVYAEAPHRNFVPSAGTVLLLDERGNRDFGDNNDEPPGTHVRIDSGLVQGQEVTSDYDPMLAKIIAWGPDRGTALDRLDSALARYTLLGVETNVEYLRLLLTDDDVRAGHLDTGLIERRLRGMTFRGISDTELIVAAQLQHSVMVPARQDSGRAAPPWDRTDGWRLGRNAPRRTTIVLPGGRLATVELTPESRAPGHTASGALYTASVDGGKERRVLFHRFSGNSVFVEIDGVAERFAFARDTTSGELWLGSEGWFCRLAFPGREEQLRRMLAANVRGGEAADPEVRSPMPGTVVSVAVRSGEKVEAGQVLVSVEAMKMEHRLVASVAGTVHVAVAAGDLVKADQVVATIHPAGNPAVGGESPKESTAAKESTARQ